MNRKQSSCSHAAAQNLPGEVLEQVLAHVPFRERIRAAAVCHAWRQHLSQRGLPLWQAASIADDICWDLGPYNITDPCTRIAKQLRVCLPLQRWLRRHGGGLLQLQCITSFHSEYLPEDGVLAALLTTLAAAAPSLQALRLEYSAALGLADSTMFGIAGMGHSLRQLALIGLLHVSDASVKAALEQMPMLQDLAIIFMDEDTRQSFIVTMAEIQEQEPFETPAPDFLQLLDAIAVSCPKLETLALGHLPARDDLPDTCTVPHWSDIVLSEQPLPESMSRLTALTALALHNVGWTYTPAGLPHLAKLRRLSLRADYDQEAKDGSDSPHQLRTLTTLEALQVMLPDWPGQLPSGLTQLVLAPLRPSQQDYPDLASRCYHFLCYRLPRLHGLRHLAFYGLQDIGSHFMDELSSAVGALPQLISLHLVKCNISVILAQLCGLSQLQLLNLAHNWALQYGGYQRLAQAPLHKLAACRRLDLRCLSDGIHVYSPLPLQTDVVAQLARMPALEQLALPLKMVAGSPQPADLDQARAQLAQCRAPGLPPISMVTEMPESRQWSTVDVELPFGEVNDMLGAQLDCGIVRGVQIDGSDLPMY